jgi:4-hydroxybenzoate polyprenyltransferase
VVDALFLLRPPLLIASSTFFFAGALAASDLTPAGPFWIGSDRLASHLLLFIGALGAAFVVNQILDAAGDAVNRKNYLIPLGIVSRRSAWIVLALLLSLTALGGFLVGGVVGYLAWGGLLLGLAYSVRPLRFKGRPVIDLLANVSAFALIGFAMGWAAVERVETVTLLRSMPYALAMGGVFLNTCIPDEAGDREAGDVTSCVYFGRRRVALTALILVSASAASAVALGDVLCTLGALGGLPAFIAVALLPTDRSSVLASQFTARLFFILVGVRTPVLLILGIVAYGLARFYYRRRLGLVYPRLEGAGKTGSQSVPGNR